jgi:hypothetical protein
VNEKQIARGASAGNAKAPARKEGKLFFRLGVNGFAVFHRAAAFAFAGVLAGAAVVSALAAAFAFAGVLSGAIVRFAFLCVGENTGGNAGLINFRDGRGVGDLAAAEDAGERGPCEERFARGITFHSMWVFCCFVILTTTRSILSMRAIKKG